MDNLWIAALARADQARLKPHLHERSFERGQMLYDAGEDVSEVWFPLRGVVSLMTLLPEDRMVETGAVGREGIIGVTCGPLNARAASRAISQIGGVAACCPADVFSEALDASEPMRLALAKFTESLFAQVQQTAACNAQHRLDERLARWLLAIHDRADGNRFDLTQADIAGMLGVRRATVSEVGTMLEEKGLIHRGRGWVEVLDRKALEAHSCGCYAAMRTVMEDLDVPVPHAREIRPVA